MHEQGLLHNKYEKLFALRGKLGRSQSQSGIMGQCEFTVLGFSSGVRYWGLALVGCAINRVRIGVLSF